MLPQPLRTSALLAPRHVTNFATLTTFPRGPIILKVVHGLLDLRAQIGAVELLLVHLLATALAVPAQPVHTLLGSLLLEHDANSVSEAHGIVRRIGRQQEHIPLVDVYVAECALVDRLEQHGALVLVEPLGGLIDVVICACVWAAHNLGG